MESVKFYIKALAKEFIINLATNSFMGIDVVVTSNMRPATYKTPACFSEPMLGKEMRMVQYVQDDIDNLVAAINNLSPNSLDSSKINDALIYVCQQHIKRCNRIWFADLLMYIDIYIYVLGTIFPQYRPTLSQIYSQTAITLEKKFEMYIQRPPLF